MSRSTRQSLTYAASGVDIDKKDAFTESLDSIMRRTHGPRVISNPGGFAGLFRLDYNQKLFARNYKDPVLVACCDGVGTKVKLAAQVGIFDTLGIDLVAMNVNDLIVQGAEPLFFLDYLAVPSVDTKMLTDLVKGVAEGCRQSSCALLGGETANMPDVYAKDDFDMAGFCVGVVELKRAINPSFVKAGDVILGCASHGIHSNGYTLVRKIVETANLDLHKVYDEVLPTAKKSGKKTSKKKTAQPTLGQVLLTPTRIYAASVAKMLKNYKVKNVVTGMAHITGSGMEGNLCRALPPNLDAVVDVNSWPVLPVFKFLQEHGNVPEKEMRRVFNMGIGYCVIVRPAFADSVAATLKKAGEKVYKIGHVVKNGTGKVIETGY
ncbi:MAG: phosphoribosylformylglycinamidine cyclo-ligase [Planctomycetes bacterium]|nr:phosphoribosylformylglycinamidine cyclo-ligase [Planctomycetota bacterium]